jgi:ABC-type nitrate/sulfonate/bicarbonate transport system permease component
VTASSTAARSAYPRLRLGWRPRLSPPWLVFLALIGLWEAATASGWINQLVLPTPTAVAVTLVTAFPDLAGNAAYTAAEAVLGMVLGNAAGFALAACFIHSAAARRTVLPLAIAAQAVPIVAVAPALILLMGDGMAPKIAVTAFLVFFPMLVNAMRGLRSADADVEEILYTLRASAWQRLWKVRVPASLPLVFSALRLSACACFVAAIVAEWVSASRGLGYLIVFCSSQYRVAEVWAAVLIGTALSMALYALVAALEARMTPWLVRRQIPDA